MRRLIISLILVGAAFGGSFALAIDWPMDPINQAQPLGNSYGEYQYYGGSPYYHPGIDILRPAGTFVRAVKSGYVKAVLTTAAELHWRVAIGDSAGTAECDGWLYAHLDQFSITVLPGDWVQEGDYIGELVVWPIADFHHLHFVKIRHSGQPWNSNWEFIANPLDELSVTTDADAPVIETAATTQLFAYYDADDHVYFPAGSVLSGPVDVIAKVYDRIGHPTWRLAPYAITYEVFNDTLSLGPRNCVTFTGQLFWSNFVTVVYNDDGVYNSNGDYNNRDFYFIVTNTDGDSVIESSDAIQAWHTEELNNGNWWVKVTAYDRAGNVDVDSMLVTTENFFSLTGTAIPCDGDPDSSGATVTAVSIPGNPATMTGSNGGFDLGGVTLGTVAVRVERIGYATVDTSMVFPGVSVLGVELQPTYLLGDMNADGVTDPLDLNRLIDLLFFASQQWPIPFWSADMNYDRLYDPLDLNILIDILFFSLPNPGPLGCYP